MAYFVHILTNRPNGTLYVRTTNDLPRRTWERRTGEVDGFARQYGLKRLVYFEAHEDVNEAIAREKRLKRWRRAWKDELTEKDNPAWDDLYSRLNA